jgi:CDP-glycerol glycerophosphotransferase
VCPFFRILPLNRKRIFINVNNGKSFSDNPKAIFDYLQENGYGYRFVVTSQHKRSNSYNGTVVYVRYMSPKYLFYISTSKYWIVNINLYSGIKKRKEQIYLQTWHGTPLKHIGKDILNKNRASEKREWSRDANQWDYFISNGAISNINYQTAFGINKSQILDFGLPRNDNLKNNTAKFNFKEFEIKLGKKYFLIVNFHRLYPKNNYANSRNVLFNSILSIEECMEISDILITDYSSVFFDYSMLAKPMIFYPYDLQKYLHEDRGMYFDYEKLVPGSICKTFDELIDILVNETYREFSLKFAKKFNSNFIEHNATEKVVKRIFK